MMLGKRVAWNQEDYTGPDELGFGIAVLYIAVVVILLINVVVLRRVLRLIDMLRVVGRFVALMGLHGRNEDVY